VFQGGTWLGTAPADANGSWSLDLSGSPFTDGPSTLTAKATDAAGNESSLSSSFQLTVDTAGAQLLSIMREAPSGAATNVNTLTYQVTFNETVIGVDAADFTVSGGSTATVSSVTPVGISGTVYDVTVSDGDLASFNGAVGLSLKSGHTITDVAANPLANATPAGADQSYSLDNTPPAEPTFSTVAGDGTISEGDRTTGVTLTGTTDLGSTVTLLIEGQSRAAIVAGATWTYTLQDADYSALGEGSKTITATAMDAVGNVSTVGSVSFTVDTVAPPAPTVLAVADADNALFNAGFSVASGAAVTLIGCQPVGLHQERGWRAGHLHREGRRLHGQRDDRGLGDGEGCSRQHQRRWHALPRQRRYHRSDGSGADAFGRCHGCGGGLEPGAHLW
jgi:hypothetical protein